MAKEWGNPGWKDQGRTGPHGPRYAKRSDRRKVSGGICGLVTMALAGGVAAAVAAIGYGFAKVVL